MLLPLGLLVFLLMYAAMQLALAARLARVAPDTAENTLVPADLPPVTVLVAARNEQSNLPRCLNALAALDYPADRLTVLIADDASTDATPLLLREAARERPNWRILTITERLGVARGKGNALAHLIRAAETEWLVCCDADIAVPPQWARALVAEGIRTGAALVVGTTLIEGADALAASQRLDWQRALATLRVATALGRPFTGMGNNQLLRRSAYHATGGYEALPFSITEDFQLFQEMRRHGYSAAQVLGAGALAWSAPAESWAALLRQRRRWVRGLLTGITPLLAAAALVEAAVFPALFVLLWLHPALGGLAWVVKLGAQAWLIRVAGKRLGLPTETVGEVLRYEVYLLILALVLPIVAVWPGRISWKGREL